LISIFNVPFTTYYFSSLPIFITGSSLAILYKSLSNNGLITKINKNTKISNAINALSFVMIIIGVRLHVWLFKLNLFGVGYYCIYWSNHMLLMLIGAPNSFTNFLGEFKLLKLFGKYSYGFYLFHGFSITLFRFQSSIINFLNDDYLLKICFLYGQALVFGIIYFHFIEKNCIYWAKSINNRLTDRIKAFVIKRSFNSEHLP
jgi:peptidoglycan/LPS O-acetylase OafA/YrhL